MFEYPLGEGADASLLGLTLSYNDLRSLLQGALNAAEPTDPDGDGDNDTHAWICDLYGTHVIYSCDYDDAMPLKMRSYSVDPQTKAVTLGDPVAVMRKTMYIPAVGGSQESARPETVYVSEAGSRHSKDDAARIQSMHDSADAIKQHAVSLLGPSAPTMADGTYGAAFLPFLQSTREGAETLLESGEGVAITDRGTITDFTEAATADGATKGVATITIIRPGFNTSGKRYYTKEALSEAATKGTFGDLKMYIDHPTLKEEKELPERSFSRIGAIIKETRLAPDGSLTGEIAVVNPHLKETLALFKQQGVLHHVGVSINAVGTVREGEVEGRKTHIVSAFTQGKSVDFVTEPGAGGRIALYESSREDEPATTTNKESGVNEDQVKQILAELNSLKESNVQLQAKVTESDQRAVAAEARAKVQAAVAQRLGESALPAIAKARIQRMFEDATDGDRLEEAVKAEESYIAEIEKAVKEANPKRGGVVGLGAKVTEGGKDVIAPTRGEIADELAEAAGTLFGTKESAKSLIAQMIG